MGLQERFKAQYQKSNAFAASAARDIPPVSSVVLWMRQIECKVKAHLERVKFILGAGWENHVEGKQLKVRAEWAVVVSGGSAVGFLASLSPHTARVLRLCHANRRR